MSECENFQAGKEAAKRTSYRVRCTLIRTLAMIRRSLEQAKAEQAELLLRAGAAKEQGDGVAYSRAKSNLRMCLNHQRLMENMAVQVEMTLRLEDMDGIVRCYNDCMTLFKQEVAVLANIQAAHRSCLEYNADQREIIRRYAELSDCLGGIAESQSPLQAEKDELDYMICESTGERGAGHESSDALIAAKLAMLKSKMERM